MPYVLKKELSDWLEHIIGSHNLVAPQIDDGVLLYKPVDRIENIVWEYQLPVNSIKEVFFPPTETLLKFNGNGEDVFIHETIPSESKVLFGVRPCDMHGIRVLDAMFIASAPQDVHYSTRREHTVIVGMTCQEMGESCFCTSMGGGPEDSTGMDVVLTADENGYFIEVLTEKGEILTGNLKLEIVDAEKKKIGKPPNVEVPNAEQLRQSFRSELWSKYSDICISCRVCAYVCPTCRCFDVRDELNGSNGQLENRRIRCWDSCSSEAYRKIAGGHNPREMKSERLRNRVMCKLYYYPAQYGLQACTGCGRCIETCPVHIDVTEIMGALMEVNQQ